MDKLKAITIFVEIADQGSMSAAARSLGIANSVVSKNLTELETWLGRRLIFRSTRSLRLTHDGLIYLEGCRDILAGVAKLETQSIAAAVGIAGDVKITAPLYLGQKLLPSTIAEVNRGYPGINLGIVLTDNIEDMTRQGFDIALRASQPRESSLPSKRLMQVRLVTIASPHYLFSVAPPTSPAELKKHPCILESSTSQHQGWRFRGRNNAQSNLQITSAICANTGQFVKSLCLQGIGIAQLPDFMVEQELANGQLIELLPEYALDNFYIEAVYHHSSYENKAVMAVLDRLSLNALAS